MTNSSFEGISREPTLPGNNTGEEAEPGTPGWAWAGQEVWTHGQAHQRLSAMTVAMTMLSTEARKMIPCTEATMAEGRSF